MCPRFAEVFALSGRRRRRGGGGRSDTGWPYVHRQTVVTGSRCCL